MSTTHTPTRSTTTECGILLPLAACLPMNPSPADMRLRFAMAGVFACAPEVHDWRIDEWSLSVWLHETGDAAEADARAVVGKLDRIIPGRAAPVLLSVGDTVIDEKAAEASRFRPSSYPEGKGGWSN